MDDRESFDAYYSNIDKQVALHNSAVMARFTCSDLFLSLLATITTEGAANYIVFKRDTISLYSVMGGLRFSHHSVITPDEYEFGEGLDEDELEVSQIILACQFSSFKVGMTKNKKLSVVLRKAEGESIIEVEQLDNSTGELHKQFSVVCEHKSSLPLLPRVSKDTEATYLTTVDEFASNCEEVTSVTKVKTGSCRAEDVNLFVHRGGKGLYMCSYSPTARLFLEVQQGSITRQQHFVKQDGKCLSYRAKNSEQFCHYKFDSKALRSCVKLVTLCDSKGTKTELELRCEEACMRLDTELKGGMGTHTIYLVSY